MLIQQANQNQTFQAKSLQQDIAVKYSYGVHFTRGLFDTANPLLADVVSVNANAPKSIIVAVDSGVLKYHPQLLAKIGNYTHHHGDKINLAAQPIIIPGGEASKNDTALVENIQRIIEQAGICRHSYVLAIGGGAVVDMVGYAAATAHRGVRLIRIPTTVLAQNDSGVGVKNNINAFGKKNFLGTFAPPVAVLNDFDFLTTLSDLDWRSGIAEAIKVALIKDKSFFEFIRDNSLNLANRNMQAMEELIYRCCQLHLNHIATYGDPFEMGSSRPLDFGHWSAHKLEHVTNYGLRHGEAVAIGMALDCTFSYLTGMLSKSDWQQIINTLQQLGFALYVPELSNDLTNIESGNSVFSGIAEFREHLGGELAIMLLKKIGVGVKVNQVSIPTYVKAVLMLQEIEARTVTS